MDTPLPADTAAPDTGIIEPLEAAWRAVLSKRFGVTSRTTTELLWELEASTADVEIGDVQLLVLSSGSATGKTHFGRHLRTNGWQPIARTKDRPIRVDEVAGVDGHFVDHPTFDRMLLNNQLVGVTGSYGDRRGYDLPEVLGLLARSHRCVSSDGYSLVRLAAETPDLQDTRIGSIYLLPPNLPTLVNRITTRALDRFDPSAGKSVRDHLDEQKIVPRLFEGPRYLREAFEQQATNGHSLVDRFVVYDDPHRVMKLLGLS